MMLLPHIPIALPRIIFTRTITRTMSSALAPKNFEFVCIMPDYPDAQAKRLEVRPRHFVGLGKLIDDGTLTWGGAMLNSVPESDDVSTLDFHGSVLTIAAESLEQCWEILKADPYVTEGVWDIEKAQVYPFKCAVRQPLKK